jgi:hypothetical protein
MNAIQEVKDEAIRKVAQTLRSSGLASSETEAVRMAIAMSKTSQRVAQNFNQKKEGATMGSHPFVVEPKNSEEEDYPHITNAFGSARKVQESHVQAPFSVQEKPSKTEEKEEFIFGDVQEEKSAQKKDPYVVEDEFEEVISQEVIGTKVKPVVAQTNYSPRAFGSPNVQREHVQASQATVHEKPSTPVQRPIDSTQAPLSAQSSAQMAFASLLGSAQRTQIHNQEAKPAAHASPVQTFSENVQAAQPAPQQTIQHSQPIVQAAHVVINHAPDPRANMMKEANVDLSKMFNVNK